MANVYTSLADLIKINDQNLANLDLSDLLDEAPLLKALFAQVASNGTEHKYLKQTGAPQVGFRAANDGRENKASADTLVTITLKILDASFMVDKSLADAYQKGGRDAYVAREAKRHLKAAFAEAEQQILYGVANDAAGFVGLSDSTAFDALADSMVVNAGGTTAATGASVWLFRTAEDGASIVTGQDGEISMDETVVQRAAGATGWYPAYFTPISGWLGMQIGNAYSVVRIANITADSGKGLTDALISTAISKFKASQQPNLIAMSRRSLMQLQKSRTATTTTGAPAPIPEESFKVPIVVTDQLSETEALLT